MFGKRRDDDEDGPFIFGNQPDDESTDAEISSEDDWSTSDEDDWSSGVDEVEEFEEEDLQDFPEEVDEIQEPEEVPEPEVFADDWDEPVPVEKPAAPLNVKPVLPKERVKMTNQTTPASRRSGSKLDFNTALKIVEMKFQFWKYVAVYLTGGIIVFIINFILNRYEYEMPWWFQWPLIVYGIFLIYPFCRAYVFKGQDIHSMVQGKLQRMAEKEIERTEIYEE